MYNYLNKIFTWLDWIACIHIISTNSIYYYIICCILVLYIRICVVDLVSVVSAILMICDKEKKLWSWNALISEVSTEWIEEYSIIFFNMFCAKIYVIKTQIGNSNVSTAFVLKMACVKSVVKSSNWINVLLDEEIYFFTCNCVHSAFDICISRNIFVSRDILMIVDSLSTVDYSTRRLSFNQYTFFFFQVQFWNTNI